MSKIWREHTGQKTTLPRLYGMMFGLAQEWPDGYQVKIFEHALKNWTGFCAAAKQEIYTAMLIRESGGDPFAHGNEHDPLLETARWCQGQELSYRYYKHVSLPFLRKLSHIAKSQYCAHCQKNGVELPFWA